MRQNLDFQAGRKPNSIVRLEGLEWDRSLAALAFTGLPGDRRVLGKCPMLGSAGEGISLACVETTEGDWCTIVAGGQGTSRGLFRLEIRGDGLASRPRPWPTESTKLGFNPGAIAAGPRRLLAATDASRDRVVLLDALTGEPRGDVSEEFASPLHLAWDRRGRLYVSGAHGVVGFDGSERDFPAPVRLFGGGNRLLPGPVACEPSGHVVFVAGNALHRFDAGGEEVGWEDEDARPLSLVLPETAGRLDWDLRGQPDGETLLPATAKALAIAFGDGRYWMILADESGRNAKLHVLNPETLRLTVAGPSSLAVAIGPSERRTANVTLPGRLVSIEPDGRDMVLAAYLPRASRAPRGSIDVGPLIGPNGGDPWRSLRIEASGEWPEGVRSGLVTLTTTNGQDGRNSRNRETPERIPPPPEPDWYSSAPPPAAGTNWIAGANSQASPANEGSALPDDRVLTPPGYWRPAPDDVRETRLWHEPGNPRDEPLQLRGKIYLRGDATSTPRILGLTVEAGQTEWLSLLPAIYGRGRALGIPPSVARTVPRVPVPIRLLDGLLDLFQSALADRDARIDALPGWFDPEATPAPTLLARHLGIDGSLKITPTGANDVDLRHAIGPAWQDLPSRGTPGGLARAIRAEVGIDVRLDEPIVRASLWVLGDESCPLGGGTQLAAGPIEPGSLDETATLDVARLDDDGTDAGADGLWGDDPYVLIAQVFEADAAAPGQLERLSAKLEQTAPAYLTPVIEIIRPRARIGRQSVLGVDTVLGRDRTGGFPWQPPDSLGPSRRLGPRPAAPPGAQIPLRIGRSRLA